MEYDETLTAEFQDDPHEDPLDRLFRIKKTRSSKKSYNSFCPDEDSVSVEQVREISRAGQKYASNKKRLYS